MEDKPGSWRQQIKLHPMMTTIIMVVGVLVIAVIVAIIGGYLFNWEWTGIRGGVSKVTTTMITPGTTTATPETTVATEQQPAKTLWDWLGLLAVLAIPVVVGLGAAWFTWQQNRTSNEIALNNQRESALQAYIDKMSKLLALQAEKRNDIIKPIAQARTFSILQQLDQGRKVVILQFLNHAGLISKGKPIVILADADLRKVDLSTMNFSKVALNKAKLNEANLEGADLSEADLSYADLSGANLSGARLSETDLSKATLWKTTLWKTDLSGANLSEANLEGVTGITIEELEKQAKSLKGATMPDGQIPP